MPFHSTEQWNVWEGCYPMAWFFQTRLKVTQEVIMIGLTTYLSSMKFTFIPGESSWAKMSAKESEQRLVSGQLNTLQFHLKRMTLTASSHYWLRPFEGVQFIFDNLGSHFFCVIQKFSSKWGAFNIFWILTMIMATIAIWKSYKNILAQILIMTISQSEKFLVLWV